MSRDTFPVLHAFLRSVARTNGEVSPSLSKKCRTANGKILRMPKAGTFFHVLIFLRVDLDTLLGVLEAYVVAF